MPKTWHMDLLAIALAPGLAIILFILYRDKFDREPPLVMLVSFSLGMLATLPAIALETAADYLEPSGVQGTVLFAFLGVALVEELVKFVPLRWYSLTRASFDEPLDGIVHGVMIGMGFATVENLLYVFRHGMEAGWLRMFTAVPGHASWGVIMGYYAGKAKFDSRRRNSILATGFLLAVFFHGLYDACLFVAQQSDKATGTVLAWAAVTTHVVALLYASRLVRQQHYLSKGLHHHKPVLTVRHAGLPEIPLIQLLAKKIWPATYRTILQPAQIRYMMKLIYSRRSLQKQMSDGHQFLLVYNNAVPVGFVSFSKVEPTVFKLHKIYLLRNQQGRGTGSFAIQQVIETILPGGATALRLNVNRHNPAKAFYEKKAFKTIAEEKIDIGSGYFMDDYIMEMKLNT